MSQPLPKFDEPPLAETVLGVQFVPVAGFRNAHLGAFWKQLGSEWPHVNDAAPLEPQHEHFDQPSRWRHGGDKFTLRSDPSARVQIRNSAGDRMIQLQNGRLHYNWIAVEGKRYPSYNALKPDFDRVLGLLQAFLATEGLKPFTPDQWEVTYVNHIPRGEIWDSPAEWSGRVVPALVGSAAALSSARMESCRGDWAFEIPPARGRLHVELRHAILGAEKPREALVLKLTARGPIKDGDQTIDQGLNLGHETIVRAFADITSDEAQSHWRRVQ